MTDLTDRMRTCAATLLAENAQAEFKQRAMDGVPDLLIEASNMLEELHSTGALRIPADLGEPMEIIPTVTPTHTNPWVGTEPPKGTWIDPGGALPTVSELTPLKRHPRVCPKCDSRTTKKVLREGSKLMLACPVCSTQWEWKR